MLTVLLENINIISITFWKSGCLLAFPDKVLAYAKIIPAQLPHPSLSITSYLHACNYVYRLCYDQCCFSQLTKTKTSIA